VLNLELLNVAVELPLHSPNLLRNQIGTVLQVATDVTHLIIPPLKRQACNHPSRKQFRLDRWEPPIKKRRDFSATELRELSQNRASRHCKVHYGRQSISRRWLVHMSVGAVSPLLQRTADRLTRELEVGID
jgi:hypothetical protein